MEEMADAKASNVCVKNTIVGRMEQLVNNEYLSDVTFLLGNPGQIMYGHKVILSLASDVLFALFNGHFAEAEQDDGQLLQIAIPDIEPQTFYEILFFIYCEDVRLNKDNVLDIYYAAKKYMLSPLEQKCEVFIRDSINEKNVLKIFNDNRRHEFDNVNERCLGIICDNPLECFKYDLLTLEKRSVKLIIHHMPMNCHKEQLLGFIRKWHEHNKHGTELFSTVSQQQAWDMNCRKMRCFSDFDYANKVATDFDIKVEGPGQLSLYGLGIWLGTQVPCGGNCLVNLTVEIDSRVIIDNVVPLKPELYVKDVLFEKVFITCNKPLRVKCLLVAKQDLFYLKSFKPVNVFDPAIKVKINNNVQNQHCPHGHNYNQCCVSQHKTMVNCVAHLYYNVE